MEAENDSVRGGLGRLIGQYHPGMLFNQVWQIRQSPKRQRLASSAIAASAACCPLCLLRAPRGVWFLISFSAHRSGRERFVAAGRSVCVACYKAW